MHRHKLELGAVFQPDWNEHPIRVIAFDSKEVMYDVWWPHKNAWGLSMFKGTVSYYRLPTSFFLDRARYVRTDEYTDAEEKLHRPDLPLSFGRHKTLNWSRESVPSIDELAEKLVQSSGETQSDTQNTLAIPTVCIQPFGPKDGAKPGILVTSRNDSFFTEAELLWHAWQLQAPYLREPPLTQGIGLYRSGLQRRTPSYYIWGAQSKAESSTYVKHTSTA